MRGASVAKKDSATRNGISASSRHGCKTSGRGHVYLHGSLFILALLILVTLGTFWLLRRDPKAQKLLRRVASRRSDRCELSLDSAMRSLPQQDRSLLACLLPFTKFKLDMTLDNMS